MGDSDLGISVPRELIVLKILSSGWHPAVGRCGRLWGLREGGEPG